MVGRKLAGSGSDLTQEELQKLEARRNATRERPEQIVPPQEGQESVWDYPRPPVVEPVSKSIRVEFGGVVLGETELALRVIETAGPPVYYLPPEDVRTEFLEQSNHTSLCEWKGRARYWHVKVGDRYVQNAAWAYEKPLQGYENIESYLAFYAQKMDACFVGDEFALPQPGNFYGGWVTSKVVGPFKGEPGSSNW